MPLSLSLELFPDVDGLDGMIESTMPVFGLLLFALAIVLVVIVISDVSDRLRHRSPVDKLLRARR